MRRDQRDPHPLALARRRRSPRGLSLVELLLSASLGIVLLGSAVAVLLAAGRMRRNHQLLSEANDEARTALRVVARSLTATGAGGSAYRYLDSGGATQMRSAIFFEDNLTKPLHPPSMMQTPDSLTVLRYGADRRGELVAPLGKSTVYITPDPRQAGMKGVESLVLREGESALITNFQRAILLPVRGRTPQPTMKAIALDINGADANLLQDTSTKIEPGASVFPVQIVRYSVVYVPALGNLPERGDLVADTLDPITLNAIPQARTVVARDVEDFQMQWALDNNDDGVADSGFTNTGPDKSGIEAMPAFARILIAVRTSNTLQANNGEYVASGELTPFEQGLDVGNTVKQTASGYRRRVLSTVVLLKNLIASRI